MNKVPLNSDLLNDGFSIYFQIDRFSFVKFPAPETGDFIGFFARCYKTLKEEGIEHKALFVPFNIYANVMCLINDSQLYDLTDTFESVLEKSGMIEQNLVVYVPDEFKDRVKL